MEAATERGRSGEQRSEAQPAAGAEDQALRAEQGITRERLAEQVGVSARFLADVEAGKVGLSLPTLVNLCRALGTSADYLLGLTGEPSPWEELGARLRQTDPRYLPGLRKVVQAYLEAVGGDVPGT